MKITIEFDEQKLINDVVQNLPEYSVSLRCVDFDYKHCRFDFEDDEDGKEYTLTYEKFRKGLKIMLKLLATGHLKGVASYVMPNFEDTGNWDGVAVDCLVQCAIFGEVIYG